MKVTELAVIYALNDLQRPAPGEPGRFLGVTAKQVTDYIRKDPEFNARVDGLKWRPTKGQVRWVLTALSGRVTDFSTSDRIEDPLVWVEDGEPNHYGLTTRATRLMLS